MKPFSPLENSATTHYNHFVPTPGKHQLVAALALAVYWNQQESYFERSVYFGSTDEVIESCHSQAWSCDVFAV